MKEKIQECHRYCNFDGVSMEIGVSTLLEERGQHLLLDMLVLIHSVASI